MNVILVDDEDVALNALKRRVDWKKYGFEEVFAVGSAQQAREVFQNYVIDVMISDIEMPGGSGLELFEWVKSYYPAVECVYVTCHPEFDYVRKALQLGSADYLLKPIDYEELDEILSQLVERCRRHTVPSSPSVFLVQTEGPGEKDDVIETVKCYVRDHIHENICIADIAAQVFWSSQHLMRTFKNATGLSVLEYITNERLRLAEKLLVDTNLPINRVADSVGYGNYSYFTRLFKRSAGLTPQAFREVHGNSAKN